MNTLKYIFLLLNILYHLNDFDGKHTLQDVTGLRDTCQRAYMFQKANKKLGYMKIIVFKIPLGEQNHIYPMAYNLLFLYIYLSLHIHRVLILIAQAYNESQRGYLQLYTLKIALQTHRIGILKKIGPSFGTLVPLDAAFWFVFSVRGVAQV